MDKQDAPDSLATVAVKPDYPPSEVFGSEPPPAYHKPRSTAVQVARIVAVTLVLMSFILGAFILAAAWVQATASCHQLQQQEDLEDHPSFQQLVDPLQSEESGEGEKEHVEPPPQHQEKEEKEKEEQQDKQEQQQPVHFKLPLTLDFDELAGAMVERNQRSRMNCVVEKRRAEQIVDHQPRTVRLPFGLNLTSDPRYEHVTGEKMAIFCESGKDQRHMPMEMMAAPIVVPLPGPVHLPLQFHGPMQQNQKPRAMPLPLQAAIQVAEASRHNPFQMPQTRHNPFQMPQSRHLPIQVQVTEARPVPLSEARHIPFQVAEVHQIPVQMAEARQLPVQITEARHIPVQMVEGRHIPVQVAEGRHIPIQMAEGRHIPVQMAEGRHIPVQVTEARPIPIHVAETTREARNFQEARGQGFRHMLPIHVAESPREGRAFQPVPVPMMQQMPPEPPRPHYVQPRSVRSVDDVLHKREKRMRRCACDCAC